MSSIVLALPRLLLQSTLVACLLAGAVRVASAQQQVMTLLCSGPLLADSEQARNDMMLCQRIASVFQEEIARHQEIRVEPLFQHENEAIEALFASAQTKTSRFDIWLGGAPERHRMAEREGLTEVVEEIYSEDGTMMVSVVRFGGNFKLAYEFLDWLRLLLQERPNTVLGVSPAGMPSLSPPPRDPQPASGPAEGRAAAHRESCPASSWHSGAANRSS